MNDASPNTTITPAAFSAAAFGAVPYFPGKVEPFLEMLGWRHYDVHPSIVVDPATCGPPRKGEINLDKGQFLIRSTYGVYVLAEEVDTKNKDRRRVILSAPCSAAFRAFHEHFADPAVNPPGLTAEEAGAKEWSVVSAWDSDSRIARIQRSIQRYEDNRAQDLKAYGHLYQVDENTFCNDGLIYMIEPANHNHKRIYCLASPGKGSLPLRSFEHTLRSRLRKLLRWISLTGHPVGAEEVLPIIRRDADLRIKAIFAGEDPRTATGDPYFNPPRNWLIRYSNLARGVLTGIALGYGLAMKNFSIGRFKKNAIFNGLYYGAVAFLQAGAMTKGILWRSGLRLVQGVGKAVSTTMNQVSVVGAYQDGGDRTKEFWARKGLPSVVNGMISRTIDPEKVPHLRPVRFEQTELGLTEWPVRSRIAPSFGPHFILDQGVQPMGTIIQLWRKGDQLLTHALEPNGLSILHAPAPHVSFARYCPEHKLPDAQPMPTAVERIMKKIPPEADGLFVDKKLVDRLRTEFANATAEEADAECVRHFMPNEQANRLTTLMFKRAGKPDPLLDAPKPDTNSSRWIQRLMFARYAP